jgi:hypothetical protein
MRFFIFVSVLCLPALVLAQQWALRPEFCLTAGKAKLVSNTNPYLPFRSTYSNNLDVYLNVDFYFKQKYDRLTFTIGTYQTNFTMTGLEQKSNGYLGFLFPSFFLSEGTSGSVYFGASYSKSILKKETKNKLYLLGGAQYYSIISIGSGSSAGPYGDFVLYDTEILRQRKGNPGWHIGASALLKNKKDREVLQLTFKYQGTFNATQFTGDYFYSMITPTDPPEVLHNQVLRYRLTGAGIQIGLSKTLRYFPRQRNMENK